MSFTLTGSTRQISWATSILNSVELTDGQIETLLKYAGPTMHSQRKMDAAIIIDNRHHLASYADGLAKFLELSPAEKHRVAIDAANAMRRNTETS